MLASAAAHETFNGHDDCIDICTYACGPPEKREAYSFFLRSTVVITVQSVIMTRNL